MKGLILVLISFSSLSGAFAAPASYETQLFKLSKSLKGVPPTLEERTALQNSISWNKAEAFLAAKTQEYVKTPQFNLKLKQKVDELMRFIPQTGSLTANFGANRPTAYDLFVENLIAQNLSWNHLLTGKSYRTRTQGGFFREETEFYSILKNIPDNLDYPTSSSSERALEIYDFDANDSRIAGVLTTPRFFDRYVNTALNKNRRRAAAVFRIFMCDTMIPSVPTQDSASEKADYDRIFPDHKNLTESQIRKSLAGNVHGQQADCMACHYKLDPLGQTFGFSSSTAAPKPAPGALRYQGQDGRKVDITVTGVAELGQKIAEQPEFAKCQVSHFWRWYIGKDVPLTAAKEEELVKKFDQVGRKPQDFVAHLVTLPEFKEKPQILTEDQLLARRTVKIFKNCTSCHDSTGEAVWDLTDLPYSKDPRRREKMIKEIREILDIDGNGARAEMPPEDSLWQLSSDEFDTIKQWLNRGAPDFQGTPQVAPVGGAK